MSIFPILSFITYLATWRTEIDPEYEHTYTTLTTPVSCGQTVVEDILPLSLLIGSSCSAESLQLFAAAVDYSRLLIWTSSRSLMWYQIKIAGQCMVWRWSRSLSLFCFSIADMSIDHRHRLLQRLVNSFTLQKNNCQHSSARCEDGWDINITWSKRL